MIVDQQNGDVAGGAPIGRHGKTQFAEAKRFAAALDFIFEQSIAHPRAFAELVGLEPGVHGLELRFGQRLLPQRRRIAIVIEPVVAGVQPKLRLRFRAERQARVESLIEKLQQRGILRLGL